MIIPATAAFAVDQVAELVQVFGFDEAALEAVVELGLLIEKYLRLVADHDEIRFEHGFIVQLLARQEAVAPDDAVQVHAGFDILALDDRIDGVGGGGHDVAAADRFLCRIDWSHIDAGRLAHFFCKSLAVFFRRTIDFDFAQLVNDGVGSQLGLGLFPRAEQRHDFSIFARQVFACHGAGSANAHRRDKVIVHERQDLASIHVEEHHEADEIARINPPFAAGHLNFFGKARVDAQRHGLDARDKSHDVIEVILAAFFFPGRAQTRPRRVHRLALPELPESRLDCVDLFRHGQQMFHLIVLQN